ncbi:unnamed protein product [Somion occarium]|uniref:Transmembrane protein 135 N-terminal domain-containing protein n=1 Tax=Somion occarium TaxID=3059160 RepID=A0ABP1EC71_9APHY
MDSRTSDNSADESRAPSFIQFTPKRAMASFENLVALANYEEHLKEARKIVWRDRGERPVELEDLWECAEHAGRGGWRAGGLAFAIRSGINLILLIARMDRIPRRLRFTLIRQALFGQESLRFAAMLGSFVALYKFILNALPIVLPPPNSTTITHAHLRSQFRAQLSDAETASPFDDNDDDLDDVRLPVNAQFLSERQARLSSSAQAHQVWVRKRTRRWYSVFAGAMAGGISILFEKRSNRLGIAQQMFVRGLQGSYNAFSTKRGIKIPHGDVIVFSLCSAQIMYAFLLRQDTLPRSYLNWIYSASRVPREAVMINKGLVREGVFDVSYLDSILSHFNVTPQNQTELISRRAMAVATNPTPDFGFRYAPCSAVHPWQDSCRLEQIGRFFSVFRWMLPLYGALHFIPMLLFKRNVVFKTPMKMLLRAAIGTARSSAFLGVFVMIYQSLFCSKHNMYSYLTSLRTSVDAARSRLSYLLSIIARRLPQPVVDVFISKFSFWLVGLVTGLSLFVEEKRRREELAMKGLVFKTGEFGEVLLTSIGMGMVMSIYQNDPQHLSGLVRRILYQFIGPN